VVPVAAVVLIVTAATGCESRVVRRDYGPMTGMPHQGESQVRRDVERRGQSGNFFQRSKDAMFGWMDGEDDQAGPYRRPADRKYEPVWFHE